MTMPPLPPPAHTFYPKRGKFQTFSADQMRAYGEACAAAALAGCWGRDDIMAIAAVRYCLGRMTYITADSPHPPCSAHIAPAPTSAQAWAD